MKNKNKFQTIIADCINLNSLDKFSELIDCTKNTSNYFFLVKNHFNSEGFIVRHVFDYLSDILDKGLKFVNIIVVPQSTDGNPLNNNSLYILWMVNDFSAMRFDKDSIREKHIWKDVEWGKREKNYNPKGKDPGNFWLPTEDDGKGKITFHKILSLEEILVRLVNSTCLDNDQVAIISNEVFDKIELKTIPKIKLEYYSAALHQRVKTNTTRNIKLEKKDIKFATKGKSNVYFKSSEKMKEIQDETINLMVTSPPYWDLKNYFKEGQIGQESYQEYLDRMNSVWSETYRVLKPEGSMWININTRAKNKKPILIPHDIIKQCTQLGFYLKDIIIWHKSSGIPTHKNNLVDRYEFFLWFTKTKKYSVNSDIALRINDYKNDNLVSGLTWNLNRKAGSVGKDFVHPAIYPKELIARIIELCTQEGEMVLDPFLGSGTTLIAARNTKRNCIGYEFNEGFESLIKYRIENEIDEKDSVKFHYSKKMNETIFR